jgi:putative SOS response-associated peptidase YedK
VRRRCLVPATGFYEWRHAGVSVKQPFNITPTEGVFFAFGGLWERWQPPASPEAMTPALETFTILTCAANPDMVDLHDRMPVLIPREAFAAWLDPGNADLSAPRAPRRARPGRLGCTSPRPIRV